MPDVYPGATAPHSETPDISHYNSTDVNEAEAVLNRLFYPIALETPRGTDGFEVSLEVIQLGPLAVGEVRCGAAVTVAMTELDAYHVILPTAGRLTAHYDGHDIIATPGVGIVFGPHGSARTSYDPNTTTLAVKIGRQALERELAGLLGHPIDGAIDLPSTIDLSSGPGRSWSLLIRLLRDELELKQSLVFQPLIAEQLRSSVLSGLLLSLPHRYSAELTRPAVAGPPRAIRRVAEAIHDEPERPFTVSDLAAIAGMSVRSLQEGFRRHLGCTPMAYLQQERLDRAHAALREAGPAGVTVAAVAHRWGFVHLGRFASTYRERFGQSPSTTLRSARA